MTTSRPRESTAGTYRPADPLSDWDPLDRAHQHEPYPWFRRAHAGCPVHHYVVPPEQRRADEMHENPLLGRPVDQFWTVFGYDDVREVLGRHEVFSSRQGPGPERLVAPNGTGVLLYADEPLHRLHRQIVNKAFTPRTVAVLEPRIRQICEEIVDRMLPNGRAEIVGEFAAAVPGQIFAEMFGVPPEDTAQFKQWADEIVSAFGGDPEAQARSVQTLQEVAAYFMAMFTQRRQVLADGGTLPDDLITALMTSEVEGRRFDDVELFLLLHIFLAGGNDTTASGLANAVHLLAEYPDVREELRADPLLIPNAVEEMLRLESPIQRLFRTPHTDTEIAGCPIAANDKVSVMFGAANRDPRVFEDSDTFDIHRDPRMLRKHVAFGFGIHGCVGSALARAQLRIGIETLLERLGSWRLDPDRPLVRGGNLIVRTLAELPIVWDVPTGPAHASSPAGDQEDPR